MTNLKFTFWNGINSSHSRSCPKFETANTNVNTIDSYRLLQSIAHQTVDS